MLAARVSLESSTHRIAVMRGCHSPPRRIAHRPMAAAATGASTMPVGSSGWELPTDNREVKAMTMAAASPNASTVSSRRLSAPAVPRRSHRARVALDD